jgi:hypothetical protein
VFRGFGTRAGSTMKEDFTNELGDWP